MDDPKPTLESDDELLDAFEDMASTTILLGLITMLVAHKETADAITATAADFAKDVRGHGPPVSSQ
jgi:hypothetical protein